MRAVRLGITLAVCTAAFAIPAYAVVNFQTGAGQHDKPIHIGGGGVAFDTASDSGSSSTASFPGWPSSSASDAGESSAPSFPGWPASNASDAGSSTPGFPGSSVISAIPSAVPEMSTWTMLVLGFFAVGAVRYRSVRRERARSK